MGVALPPSAAGRVVLVLVVLVLRAGAGGGESRAALS